MKRISLIGMFIIGLGIFLYPPISNMFATIVHQSVIQENKVMVSQLDEVTMEKEKEKIEAHNKELAASDLNFVDPFSDNNGAENSGTVSYYDALNVGPAIGSILIPKIDVELPIYHGASDAVLSKGAGHLENSSLPTTDLGTHSVITAHRGLPSATLFRHLNKLEVGDRFFVEVLGEIIAYEVESTKVVLPTETDWLVMNEGENRMTLLTCDPYMINTERLLVTGHIIPYEPVEDGVITVKSGNKLYGIAGFLAIFLLFLLFYLRRKGKEKGEDV